ncbi:NACHT domain-containing protein [Geodermatophilus obscurus]|uniref:NTPase (NACHT family)-like protein n=1 Tax=Geodermatophilus obscurus (strain ATCC 25078 / DSM 43160 / JCM 3152 / CCUG 61914 / KCC A-0152 / KCTC 9177 / NBRC 13315 / NRRL B-3577 / G-20) TaxID=526225 RepID=D2SC43_GEOOG|nr:NACHT domain-containing protein [Geodermatophilus obscurus]ADB74211.1 NTPase (NACHT family)-like protein [Geodermatophilus obscurus DSM 43160]
MEDLEKAFKAIEPYLPASVADWLLTVVTVLVALGVLFTGLSWLGKPLSYMGKLIAGLQIGKRRHEAARRAIFIDSIIGRIEQIDQNAEWTDRRYTELEAEVEAEGDRKGVGLLPRLLFSTGGRRRERTLGKALRTSKHPQILLQGDPGSGKSVALRHVALDMARRAKKAGHRTRLPLYVSLKDFRPAGEHVGADDVKHYILDAVSDLNDARQTRYLREHFDDGLDSGHWFLLLDGFDEIPELLGAVEVDQTIHKYANAIAAFFNGASRCRGVLASREYRGPTDDLPWPRFYLVSLSESRRRKFIKRANLDPEATRLLRTHLPNASSDVRRLADNPMFLGLLCEFVEHERAFPDTTHAVFESHVVRAFEDGGEADRIFGISKARIREVAEQFAFCMAADTGVGLSVALPDLEASMARNHFILESADEATRVARALRYIRLARSEPSHHQIENPPLSFSHRRFQEYFATCLVLKNPTIVPEAALLTDGRWRETAVTVLQMHPPTQTVKLIATANRLMDELVEQLPPVPDTVDKASDLAHSDPFAWPPRAIHLLALLDAGLATAPNSQSDVIRDKAGRVLSGANTVGIITDRKWALDVAGTAPDHVLLSLIRTSFATGSSWLREAAFRQIGRIKPLPEDVSQAVCFGLVTFASGGRLRQEWPALKAQVSNLNPSAPFLNAMRLLLIAPIADLLAHALWGALLLTSGVNPATVILASLLSYLGFTVLRGTTGFAWTVSGHALPTLMRVLRGLAGRTSWFDTIMVAYGLFITRILMIGIVPNGLWLTLALAYLFTWAPSVITVVRFNSLQDRNLAYAFPQLLVARLVTRAIHKLLQRWGWKTVALRVAYITALGVGLIFTLILMSNTDVGRQYVAPAAIVVFGVFLAAAAIAAVVQLVRLALDLYQYRRYHRRTPTSVGASDVVRLFESFRTPGFLTRTFKLLRRNRVFARSPGTEPALRDIAWVLEFIRVDIASRAKEGPEELKRRMAEKIVVWPTLRTAEVARWVAADERRARRRLEALGPDFADEVGYALEQAIAAQRSEAGEAARVKSFSNL